MGSNFYKELLGVAKSTSNSAVNLELGVQPAEYACLQKAINYHHRVKNSDKILQKLCLDENWNVQYEKKLSEMDLNDLSYLSSKTLVKKKLAEHALVATLNDIGSRNSLSLFNRLHHFQCGARYLSVADRSERHVLAKFRMYGFKWESRVIDSVRVCVLCNEAESIEHLIEDCQGTAGALREKLHQVGLHMAVDILSVSDRVIMTDVVRYLNYILDRRKNYL